jgi:hypothetical protein
MGIFLTAAFFLATFFVAFAIWFFPPFIKLEREIDHLAYLPLRDTPVRTATGSLHSKLC